MFTTRVNGYDNIMTYLSVCDRMKDASHYLLMNVESNDIDNAKIIAVYYCHATPCTTYSTCLI